MSLVTVGQRSPNMAATRFIAPAIVFFFFCISALQLVLSIRTKVGFCFIDSAYQISLLTDRPLLVGLESFINRFASKKSAILDFNHRLYGSFQLCSILLSCGDIQSNPGPSIHPCGLCCKPVKRNQKGIECEECLEWFHTNCIYMLSQSYDNHGCDSRLVWICNRCLFPNFSTSFLLNDSFSVTVSNSFGSLSSPSSPGPPLHSSSPTSPAPPRKKPVKIKLKVVSLNCTLSA